MSVKYKNERYVVVEMETGKVLYRGISRVDCEQYIFAKRKLEYAKMKRRESL